MANWITVYPSLSLSVPCTHTHNVKIIRISHIPAALNVQSKKEIERERENRVPDYFDISVRKVVFKQKRVNK